MQLHCGKAADFQSKADVHLCVTVVVLVTDSSTVQHDGNRERLQLCLVGPRT